MNLRSQERSIIHFGAFRRFFSRGGSAPPKIGDGDRKRATIVIGKGRIHLPPQFKTVHEIRSERENSERERLGRARSH